ncbi:MAG: amidohydrolase family protein [Candidatus Dormibacteraeota bacterium]|nr:amidohydrolase family protein [Candidatus Dormibacteraeota bacterium]
MSRRLRITGGLVVTPRGIRRADVVVEGERIAGLEPRGKADGDSIDASGCYVLPGGVDSHTHMLSDMAAASRSAAFGGTTTALCFTNPHAGESVVEAVERGRAEVKKSAAIDVDLHAVLLQPDRVTVTELERLKALKVRAVKVFLAYPDQDLMASDGTLYNVLRQSVRLGFITRVHCENGSVVDALIQNHLVAGKRSARYFAEARPPEVDEEAIARTLTLARLAGAPVSITHISTAGGIELVKAARALGQTVYAEVCTHHLLLDAGLYRGKRAERFLTVPPLRPKEHVEALWAAVADGTVDTIGSDHAQSRYQPEPANTRDFTSLPYGLAGIELRLPLFLAEGMRRKIPIRRLSQLLSSRAAEIFGLAPRKGTIVPGADADLVIWDPQPSWTAKGSALHDGLGESPYEGGHAKGAIRSVLLRGSGLGSVT